ncbi:hypothetical protein GA0070613_1884 [Micromonospora inositola]|uniref:Uncharacterized protein n=1 Tax=Micromonospora inositola TaxID=47865 RepID=A0A1C5HVK1_9ACTN|nr:hypothetical protein GA0070613_1884 [Micromonospora inositola]
MRGLTGVGVARVGPTAGFVSEVLEAPATFRSDSP